MKSKRSRPYVSPVRTEAARTTRSAIRRAAASLFLKRGYGATSMVAIAAEAKVAPKTVYLAYPTKTDLLADIIATAVRGDDDQVPLSQRPWFRGLERLSDRQFANVLSENATLIHRRAAAIQAMAEAAADADTRLAGFRDAGRRARRADLRVLAKTRVHSDARGRLEELTDRLYVLTSWQCFMLLTHDCGWSADRFQGWLRDGITGALAATARETTP